MILKNNNKFITFTFPPLYSNFLLWVHNTVYTTCLIHTITLKKKHKCFLSNILAHLPQEYLAHRLQRTGIEPPTFRLGGSLVLLQIHSGVAVALWVILKILNYNSCKQAINTYNTVSSEQKLMLYQTLIESDAIMSKKHFSSKEQIYVFPVVVVLVKKKICFSFPFFFYSPC